MEFRHSGNGGDRRRRVLFEDSPSVLVDSAAAPSNPTKPNASLQYADGARAEFEYRLTDLIPQRIFSLTLMLLFGLMVTAGLVTLHQRHQTWAKLLGVPKDCFAIFDLSTTANLSSWVSSSTLALAAFAAVLIYRLRRHLVDDYRGRYRVWLWSAMLLLIISANCTASLERLVTSTSIRFSGKLLWGDGYLWWILTAAVITLPLAITLLVDMRHSFLSCIAMLLAIGFYAVAAILHLGLLPIMYPAAATLQVVVTTTATHLGHLMVLMSLWTFARHVLLGAQGKLSTFLKKQTTAVKTSTQPTNKIAAGKTRDKINQATTSHASKSTSRRTDLEKTTKSNQIDFSEESQEDIARKLSKAERRRLRKQARRQSRAA